MKIRIVKILTVFSLLFFAMLTFSSTNLFSQVTKARVVKEDAVLRLKPNNESIIIKRLPIGSEFDVEEILQEWIKIKLPPDKDEIVVTGYVHIGFLDVAIKKSDINQDKKLAEADVNKKTEIPGQENDYRQWQQKLSSAKSRKKAGDTASVIGAVVSALGTSLYFTDKKEVIDIDIGYYTTTTTTRYEKKNEYLLVSVGGLIMSVIGFVISDPAKEEIRLLEIEGGNKHYIIAGLAPIKGGYTFQLKYSF
jgi:hypothetical protein